MTGQEDQLLNGQFLQIQNTFFLNLLKLVPTEKHDEFMLYTIVTYGEQLRQIYDWIMEARNSTELGST